MTQPRRTQICLDSTPYYHCIARCVRQAFLCGQDDYSGRNFDHRKQWLIDRLALQASVFAIDICAYAIMSNHYHVVLAVDGQQRDTMSDDAVIERWTRLFRGPLLIQRYREGLALSAAERATVRDIASVWRQRLGCISWFMRCLNEYIARCANAEDGCRGRFWEGRFKSIALLDEAALLSCMAYVDLNPVRAGIADSLQDSDFTSLQARLREATAEQEPEGPSTPALRSFQETHSSPIPDNRLPGSFPDYLALVEWTGRCQHPEKSGALPANAPSILEQVGLSTGQWFVLLSKQREQSNSAIGSLRQMLDFGRATGKHWLRGQGDAAFKYGNK